MKENQIAKLTEFKLKDKFSKEVWEERGLNPSDPKFFQAINLSFDIIANDLIDIINKNQTDKQLKLILQKSLKKFNKNDFDTEEKEFICDLFADLAFITNIEFKADLTKWLYGSSLSSLLKLSKKLKSPEIIETLKQPCTNCGAQLETYITQKQNGIPDTSWFVAKCNNCNKYNLITIGPNIKELKFGNYVWIKNLRKDEYNLEQALDHIKANGQ